MNLFCMKHIFESFPQRQYISCYTEKLLALLKREAFTSQVKASQDTILIMALQLSKVNSNMIFEPNHIYHIYNQGNNRQRIFFNRENYLFFLKKIREHILPFAEILAWCLMPNHFHLIIAVHVQYPTHPVTT